MKVLVSLSEEKSIQDLSHLNSYISSRGIEGLEENYMIETEKKEGEMGVGNFLGSISTIIEAAEKPLVELVKCLQIYVSNYRTVITIPTKHGDIKIDGGRKYSAQDIKEIVGEILEKVEQ